MSKHHRHIALFWRIIPALLIALCILIQHIPALPEAFVFVLWPLALVIACYWGIRYPTHANYGVMFALGLLEDVLSSAPIGLNALLMLMLRYLVHKGPQNVAVQGFMVMWAYCSLLLFVLLSAQWLLASSYEARLYPLPPMLMHTLCGALLYPAVHLISLSLERYFFRRWWFALKAG